MKNNTMIWGLEFHDHVSIFYLVFRDCEKSESTRYVWTDELWIHLWKNIRQCLLILLLGASNCNRGFWYSLTQIHQIHIIIACITNRPPIMRTWRCQGELLLKRLLLLHSNMTLILTFILLHAFLYPESSPSARRFSLKTRKLQINV